MVKSFNDGTIFKAHVPYYILEKPKQYMTTIPEGRPQLLKDSPDIQSARWDKAQ